ncbi:hypothetical protein K435DRAFT_701766, partial [Dendrothele bispora CBS 962.96]
MSRQRLISHIQVKNRQLLFRTNLGKPPLVSEPEKHIEHYEDRDILTLFNNTLKEMKPPEEYNFVAVSKYKNTNNLLTEMNTPTAAKWLRDISNSIQFETTLNSAIDLIQREFGLAINFVPTWFNPENDEDLREMEYVNELPSHS